MISMEYAKFMFKYNNKMLQILLTITSSNLKMFTLITQDKNIVMNISNPLYGLMQGEKHFIIFV